MYFSLKSLPVAVVISVLITSGSAQACNTDILTVKDWSIVPVDAHTARLATIIQSNATQKATVVNASIVFEDAAGDMLFSSYIDQGLTLSPHEAHGFQATITDMETLYHQRRQVKASVCLRSLKYGDGHVKSFD